jgi:hypothetical protein
VSGPDTPKRQQVAIAALSRVSAMIPMKWPRLTASRLRRHGMNTITKIMMAITSFTASLTGLGSASPPPRSGAASARPVSTWMTEPHSMAGLIRSLPETNWTTAPPSSSAKPTRCA